MQIARVLLREMYGYFFGILVWPSSLKLLWDLWSDVPLNFRQQAMVQTLKVQNRDLSSWARLKGDMLGFFTAALIGFAFDMEGLLGIGILFLLICFTELFLRWASEGH